MICSASQWTGFYMIGTSVVKELTDNMNINSKVGQRNVVNDGHDYDYCIYIMLEKLPIPLECVQAIAHHIPSYGAKKQMNRIHQFALRITE